MPSTTVHIPDPLLQQIDSLIGEKGISRNRFIVNACEEALKNDAGKWPKDFFEDDLSDDDLLLLKESVVEMSDAIIGNRRNRAKIEL